MNWIQWGTDIFYAILFCIITSFCFWSLWKALILTAKRFPSLVSICYRLIPIGIFCFMPFFFIEKSITAFFSPINQCERPFPGMVFLCSLKQNQIIWLPHSIWLIGILIKCIFYIKDCILLRKILNQSTYSPSDAVLDKIVRDLTKRLHLTHVPSVRYCSLTSTPVTVKKNKFIILLPQRNYSSNKLFAILLHEMIHIKHNDLRRLQFGHILTIIFWFYPVAYLFCRDIELLCETVCDQTVLRFLSDDLSHHDYFTLIISHLHSKQVIPSCIGLNNKTQLKYRMSASRSVSFVHQKRSVLCSILSGVLLLVSSSLIAQASVAPVEQINSNWYDTTIDNIENAYDSPVYTLYTSEEEPNYMNSVFLPELANAKLIDTRTAHGVNSYSYTIAPGERVTIVYIYLTPDNSFSTGGSYSPSNARFRFGLSNGTVKNYKSSTTNEYYGGTFSISSSGTYQFFIENIGNTSFTISGGYSF